MVKKGNWFPVTPGGTICIWLEANTEEEAWSKLLKDAKHMPYVTKENFIKRGYTVEVVNFTYTRKGGIVFKELIPSAQEINSNSGD